MRKTCPESEYLEIDDKIMALAKELLSSHDIQEADKISLNLTQKSTRLNAQNALKKIVGFRPKRPLYYANYEINHLPHWTRYTVENMGHFVDQMVKCVAGEKLPNSKFYNNPLGVNLNNLKNKIPDDLYSELDRFNKFIYVPAKHEFNVINRKHLFTSKEVVFIIFISLKLKDKLIIISDEARKYAEGP